jgi:phosphate starvation-inducible PhoH-like protein
LATIQVSLSKGIEPLFGTHDENIRFLESSLDVKTLLLENALEITGEQGSLHRVRAILSDYDTLVREGHKFSNGDVKHFLRILCEDPKVSFLNLVASSRQRTVGLKTIAPRGVNQMRYLEAMERCDMVFGVGPAGTGKTYLAVAQAVTALLSKQVSRIVLTRPAVEAGERLGFLPGTLQ